MICEYAHACICWKGSCHVMCGVALSAIKLINKQYTHAAMKRAAQSLRPCCKTNTNWEWPVVYIYVIFGHILSHVYTISNSCLSDISRWLRLAGSLNLQSAIYLLCSSFQRGWQCQNCTFRPPGEKRMGLLMKSNWLKNWPLSQHPGFCKTTGILQRNCSPNKSWKTPQTKDHAIPRSSKIPTGRTIIFFVVLVLFCPRVLLEQSGKQTTFAAKRLSGSVPNTRASLILIGLAVPCRSKGKCQRPPPTPRIWKMKSATLKSHFHCEC